MRAPVITACGIAVVAACASSSATIAPHPTAPPVASGASPVASITAPPTDAGTDAAHPSPGWTPPAPFVVIATAPADAPFTIHSLTTTTLAIAGDEKPTVLELEANNLSTLPSWLDAIGPLGDVNLSEDPLFPKSNPKVSPPVGPGGPSGPPTDQGFFGRRAISSVVGVSSSDAWAFVDRWGGERNQWIRSDAFRRSAGQWQKVATTKRLGVWYGAATTWHGGVLVHEANPDAERFVAFGIKSGVVVPQPARVPPPCKFFHVEAFAPVATGELIAFGHGCGNGTLAIQRWPTGAAQGSYQALEVIWNAAEANGFTRVVSADELRLRVLGAVPGNESTSDDLELVDVELRFKGGRWATASTKRAPADSLVAKIGAASGGKPTPGVQRFELRGARMLADGSVLAWGAIRVAQKVAENVLLRSRAVGSPIHLR